MNPEFIGSAHNPNQFPTDQGREVAFAGRSNSGKSSAINTILARKRLARTSKIPGRTQLINFFSVGESHRIVDLPGYGYARVSASVQEHWRGLLEAYFKNRTSLIGLIVTVDARRGPKELDQVMLDWAKETHIPAVVLLTKADKMSRVGARALEAEAVQNLGVPVVLFSTRKHQGVEEARDWIWKWLGLD